MPNTWMKTKAAKVSRAVLLGLAVLVCQPVMAQDAEVEKPNIICYMVDDLGWNHISAKQSTQGTGVEFYKTPTIEKLANLGLSFTHCYMQPNCAPTRAALLTGQYPARVNNGVYVVGRLNRFGKGAAGISGISEEDASFMAPVNNANVATAAITVAEALRENGYATAHIGKYHVGGHNGEEETLPENAGFDINIGGCREGYQVTCFASKSKEAGKWQFKGVGRGDFDKYAEPYTEAYLKRHGFPAELAGKSKHISDATGDALEETIKGLASGGKPFYIQFHTYAVHTPIQARSDLLKQAQARDASATMHENAAQAAKYAGFIASVDANLARMLAAIEDPNGDGDRSDSIEEKTLIIFTSDNGGADRQGGNLPLRGHKGMLTDGGVRVPLIAYWKGVIPPNTVSDHLVHAVDFYPTFLELAGKGWMPPADKHPLDGESFADILRDPAKERARKPVFYLFPGYLDARAQPTLVTIDDYNGKRYKLYYYYEGARWELYCLSDDVGEKTDLIRSKPEVAKILSGKLDAWLRQEGATWQPKYPIDKKSGQPAGPPARL